VTKDAEASEQEPVPYIWETSSSGIGNVLWEPEVVVIPFQRDKVFN